MLLQPPQRPPKQRPNGHSASLSVAQKNPIAGGIAGAAGLGAVTPPGVGVATGGGETIGGCAV